MHVSHLGEQVATYDLDVVLFVEHEVLRLQVPVHDLHLLQVLKHVHHLRREKSH